MEKNHFNFYGLGIAPALITTLERLKFHTATPIQHKAIPLALEGKDIVGIAQTGTGKTMAFAIPTVQHLAQNKSRALVLVPTRELAVQVKESFAKIAQTFGIDSVALIGGDPIQKQLLALAKDPRIMIATPGRFIDLIERKKIRLHEVSILVLDEADRMFDMGFAPQIDRIIKTLPKVRQTMLFSATMPSAVMNIAATHMKIPVSVEVAPPGTVAEKVTHEIFIVQKEMRKELLKKILAQSRGSVLIFCRTKIGATRIAKTLRDADFKAAEIHSDRSLSQRQNALEGFKSGRFRILVATDIAARGIDVKGIELVINYDLPDMAENYVHRIGRTGRAGCPGHAISFTTPDQKNDVLNIEKILKIALPVSTHPDIPSVEFEKPKPVFSFDRFRAQRRAHSRRRR
jgi:ATP-dependent RNA helicase RhlE